MMRSLRMITFRLLLSLLTLFSINAFAGSIVLSEQKKISNVHPNVNGKTCKCIKYITNNEKEKILKFIKSSGITGQEKSCPHGNNVTARANCATYRE